MAALLLRAVILEVPWSEVSQSRLLNIQEIAKPVGC